MFGSSNTRANPRCDQTKKHAVGASKAIPTSNDPKMKGDPPLVSLLFGNKHAKGRISVEGASSPRSGATT